MANILPLPDSSAAHVGEGGKPTKDFYNWLKSVGDFASKTAQAFKSLVIGSPTGGNLGDGTINAEQIYEDDKRVFAQAGNATGGVTFTEHDHGTPANGATITPNPSQGLKQLVTNNVAGFTVAATAEIGDLELRIVNGASAGTITFSGFEKKWTSDSLDTTNGHQFVAFIYGFSGKQAYIIKALQ